MSWLFPHTVQVRTNSQPVDPITLVASSTSLGAATAVPADVQPRRAGSVFQDWGLETTEPLEVYVSPSAEGSFTVGSVLAWDGREYAVRGVRRQKAGDSLDRIIVLGDLIVHSRLS